ncbi:MAG TPA: hypothetical protein DC039_16310 [Leclercia adecarboxylata]|nr:hypothetical protein [Leclercia adecarboxylata]
MRIFGLVLVATILAACSYIHPFGEATKYQSYSVSSHPGLVGRYDCIRNVLSVEGYGVETIFPERDTPNFFDITKGKQRIAQVDMYHVSGARMIDITLIAGAKTTLKSLDGILQPCVSR